MTEKVLLKDGTITERKYPDLYHNEILTDDKRIIEIVEKLREENHCMDLARELDRAIRDIKISDLKAENEKLKKIIKEKSDQLCHKTRIIGEQASRIEGLKCALNEYRFNSRIRRCCPCFCKAEEVEE